MKHYSDVIISVIASKITIIASVYSTVYSGADQRKRQIKHQSSASLAFVRGIHQWLENSPHKMPVTRKMFPFDDAIVKDTTGIGHRGLLSSCCHLTFIKRCQPKKNFDCPCFNNLICKIAPWCMHVSNNLLYIWLVTSVTKSGWASFS